MKTKLLTLIIMLALYSFSANAQTKLWGTTFFGGTDTSGYFINPTETGGIIFNTDANGNNFHTVYTFKATTGVLPVNNLCLANNGSLYGIASYGGANR